MNFLMKSVFIFAILITIININLLSITLSSLHKFLNVNNLNLKLNYNDIGLSNALCKRLNMTFTDKIARKYMAVEEKVNECIMIEDFVIIEEKFNERTADFSYNMKLDPKKICKHFSFKEESFKCSLEYYDKIYNEYESGKINILSQQEFKKSQNYTIYIEKFGFYYLSCFNKSETLIYDDIFNLFPYNMSKLTDTEIALDKQVIQFLKEKNTKKFDKKLNVLIIGIDSMSYQHFPRGLPLTYDYLAHQLENNIMYSSMHIIGENTYPNLLALLAGIVVEGVESLNLTSDDDYYQSLNEKFYDKYPFIWNEYEKNGYLTGFQVNIIK